MAIDLVLYDGTCGLCHRTVRFLLARDPGGQRFRFAPLQGETARHRLGPAAAQADSLWVLPASGPPLRKSRATLHLLRTLGGGWAWLARILALLPQGLGDWSYDRVAGSRHRLAARQNSLCPRVDAALRGRFLP